MSVPEEVDYRRRLAQGYLLEAREDVRLQRWRSCDDDSQLAVESAAKAVLALVGPVPRTHDPGTVLRRELASGRFSPALGPHVERLAECAELLGWDVHVQTDYGDEATGRTPWDLFDEAAAEEALKIAVEAAALSTEVIDQGP